MATEQFEYEYDLNKLTQITPVKRNFQMLVTPRFVEHYCGQPYEDFTSDLLLHHVKDGSLFIDVGAHYGYYSLLVASAYPSCKVISFEPVPENYDVLKCNIALNGLTNIETVNAAVSEKGGMARFKVMEASDSSGFYDHPLTKSVREIEVKTIRLDEYFKKVPDIPVVIKIDAEGHEPYILRGLKRLMEKSANIKLIIEFNPKCLKMASYDPRQFLDELKGQGLDIYCIDDERRTINKIGGENIHDWVEYMPDRDENRYMNLLCIKQDKSVSVLFYSHSAELDGAERSLLELVTELIEDHGAVCTIVLPYEGPLKAKLEATGAVTIIIDYRWWCDTGVLPEEEMEKRLGDSTTAVFSAFSEIKKIDPDVVITNTMVIPWGALAALTLNKPHIWFVREFGNLDHGLNFFLPLSEVQDIILKQSAYVLTNSNAVRDYHFPSQHGKHIQTVYPFVNIPEFGHLADEDNPFQNAGAIKLIICGSITPGKGQIDAVLAVGELVRRGRNIELVIMGRLDSEYARNLQGLVKDENIESYVKFAEFTSNPYPAINKADIVLVCSQNEAFGRVTVEGMMLKKVVIGTASGGTLELIEDGVTGFTYPRGDINQLADKIDYVIENGDKAGAIARNAFTFADTSFNKENYGGRVYGILADLKKELASVKSHGQRHNALQSVLNLLKIRYADQEAAVDTVLDVFEASCADLLRKLEDSELKNSQLTGLSIQQKAVIDRFNEILIDRDTQIASLAAAINEQDSVIRARNSEIEMMRSTIVFQLASRYQVLVNRIFPSSSAVRRFYEAGLGVVRTFLNGGWKQVRRKPADCRVSSAAGLADGGGRMVDIVVPVYNAFEFTRQCISSVLSSTVKVPFRILIIDDGSTDEYFVEYYKYLASKYDNIIILKNEKNIGYLQSINRGMHYSANDVLLLNTDTVVTYDWLRRLQECAYSDNRIATVTPLSNNATICSVPEYCTNNDVPAGYYIQEYADLIQKSVAPLKTSCYEIPVGVGFCIYVKRRVINRIGVFDTAFDKGYEEEVDFCLNARKKGYFNAVCTQAFVYHAGNVSFKDSQSELEKKNWHLLLKKHPYYPGLIEDFTNKDPLQPVRDAIRKNIDKGRHAQKNINIGIDAQLLIRPQWTGTERYIKELIENLLDRDLAAGEYLTVFSSNYDLGKCNAGNKGKRKCASDSIDILWDPDYYKCDIFHRTFQCYSVYDLLLLLNARRSVITIHDLIAYRHPEYFVDYAQYANYKEIAGLSARYADRIIADSEFGRKDIAKNLGVPLEKIRVSYLPIPALDGPGVNITPLMVKNFKHKHGIKCPYILYVSALFPHKNHDNLIRAYREMLSMLDKAVDLFIVGPDTHVAGYKNRLDALAFGCGDSIRFFDYVPNEDMPLFYHCADLFVFASLDEGFGIPPLEAMQHGVPVVCSRAASIPEVAGNGALVVDCTDIAALSGAMFKVMTDQGLRENLVQRGAARVRSFKEEIARMDRAEVYRDMMKDPALEKGKHKSQEFDQELKRVVVNEQELFFLQNKWMGNRKY